MGLYPRRLEAAEKAPLLNAAPPRADHLPPLEAAERPPPLIATALLRLPAPSQVVMEIAAARPKRAAPRLITIARAVTPPVPIAILMGVVKRVAPFRPKAGEMVVKVFALDDRPS